MEEYCSDTTEHWIYGIAFNDIWNALGQMYVVSKTLNRQFTLDIIGNLFIVS